MFAPPLDDEVVKDMWRQIDDWDHLLDMLSEMVAVMTVADLDQAGASAASAHVLPSATINLPAPPPTASATVSPGRGRGRGRGRGGPAAGASPTVVAPNWTPVPASTTPIPADQVANADADGLTALSAWDSHTATPLSVDVNELLLQAAAAVSTPAAAGGMSHQDPSPAQAASLVPLAELAPSVATTVYQRNNVNDLLLLPLPAPAAKSARGWWPPSSGFVEQPLGREPAPAAAITAAAAGSGDQEDAVPTPGADSAAQTKAADKLSFLLLPMTNALLDEPAEPALAALARNGSTGGVDDDVTEDALTFLRSCFPNLTVEALADTLRDQEGRVDDAVAELLAQANTDAAYEWDSMEVGSEDCYQDALREASDVPLAVLLAESETSITPTAAALKADEELARHLENVESLVQIFPDLEPKWLESILQRVGSLDAAVVAVETALAADAAEPDSSEKPTTVSPGRGRGQRTAGAPVDLSKPTPLSVWLRQVPSQHRQAAADALAIKPLPPWHPSPTVPINWDDPPTLTIADQLKRRELRRLFPDTPDALLDDVFAQSGYDSV